MSYEDVGKLINFLKELAAAVKLNQNDKAERWLQQIDAKTLNELNHAEKAIIPTLIQRYKNIRGKLTLMRELIRDKHKCLALINEILKEINEIKDMSKVRDQIITEVIHPIMKNHGWKKVKRTFVKNEAGYTKKLSIFSSKFNDYFHLSFRFEMYVKGKGTNVFAKTLPEILYVLTEETNLAELKARITADLQGSVIEFFGQYR
jgi:hypothetical protein